MRHIPGPYQVALPMRKENIPIICVLLNNEKLDLNVLMPMNMSITRSSFSIRPRICDGLFVNAASRYQSTEGCGFSSGRSGYRWPIENQLLPYIASC